MEEILAKYFSGEASASEEKEVLKWRSESVENSQAFFEFKHTWASSRPVEKPNSKILDSIFESEISPAEITVIPIWQTGLFKFAASVIIILGVVFTFYQLNQDSVATPDFIALESQILPDGTEVTLYDGANVEILDFNEVRKVKLEGKAYFSVIKDESKPFIIETESALVQVLGTSFVVDAISEDSPEVMVESGLVSFSTKDKQSEIKLAKGEMAVFDKGTESIEKLMLENDNYLAWKTHKIEFRKSSLQEVFALLEDVYNVTVEYDGDKIGSCQLTATFHEKDIYEISRIINATFDLKSSFNQKVLSFEGLGCR